MKDIVSWLAEKSSSPSPGPAIPPKRLGKREVPYGYFLKLGVVFVIYFFTAKGGLQLDAVSGFASLIWPPTGIALAALLIFGYRLWPSITLAAFLVNFLTGAAPLAAFAIAIGNTLEAVVGVYLLRRYGFDNTFESIKGTILFICFGAVLNTLISATIGVSSLFLSGVVAIDTFGTTWLAWWVGDMLGALVVGGLLTNMRYGSLFDQRIHRLVEGILLFSSLLFLVFFLFIGLFETHTVTQENAALVYLLFPFLVWVALRFGTTGASAALFIIAAVSAWGTVLGRGPFVVDSLSHNLLLLQLFIGTTAATVMVLAAAVTERSRVNRELVREKNKLEVILKSIGDGVLVVDAVGNVMLINHAAETLLRVQASEIIGQSYKNIALVRNDKGRPLALEEDLLRKVLSGEVITPLSGTNHYLPRGGQPFPVALTVAPFFLRNKLVGAIKVFRDITHEKEIDRAKSEFVSLASHQLWTPLATLKWYFEALLDGQEGKLSPGQKRYISEVYHNNERMIELVNSLLNVSRIELGTFSIGREPVKIAEVFQAAMQDLKSQIIERDINVVASVDKAARMNGDLQLLRMIFQNLLSNSIKYSSKHATIGIKAENGGEGWLYSVSDQGCGIPPADREKVFTKLFRSENAKMLNPEGGSGLGLYLVKSIIEESGGKIWFDSTVDVGTTFYISFPPEGMKMRKGEYALYH